MIGIVTVNWHGFEVTRNLVAQILKNDVQPLRLVVINNSPEEKVQFDADALFTNDMIAVIHSAENIGYAGALNQGIKMLLAVPEVSNFLLMNNDVEIAENFLSQMLAEAQRPDRIYAPLILYRDTDRVQNTGGKLHLWLGGTINLNKDTPVSQIRKIAPDFLSGCILFMHRTVVDKVGLFDERFGSYYEDLDYSLRARAAVVVIEILWQIEARHFHSYSTQGDGSYKVYLLNRNQILFAKKHLPPIQREFFIISAVLRGFLQNLPGGRFPAYLRGVQEGLQC
jgi:GT2 family glycosyltransferase